MQFHNFFFAFKVPVFLDMKDRWEDIVVWMTHDKKIQNKYGIGPGRVLQPIIVESMERASCHVKSSRVTRSCPERSRGAPPGRGVMRLAFHVCVCARVWWSYWTKNTQRIKWMIMAVSCARQLPTPCFFATGSARSLLLSRPRVTSVFIYSFAIFLYFFRSMISVSVNFWTAFLDHGTFMIDPFLNTFDIENEIMNTYVYWLTFKMNGPARRCIWRYRFQAGVWYFRILNQVVESQLFLFFWKRCHQWLSDIELIQLIAVPASSSKIKPLVTAGKRIVGLKLSRNARTPENDPLHIYSPWLRHVYISCLWFGQWK